MKQIDLIGILMQRPDIISIGYKLTEEQLWRINAPIETMLIQDLQNNLDIPYLEKDWTDDWNMSPRMLIDNFGRELPHAQRVESCQLNYPIEIYFHKEQWIILDDVHRFTKAVKEGYKTILVRKIDNDMLDSAWIEKSEIA